MPNWMMRIGRRKLRISPMRVESGITESWVAQPIARAAYKVPGGTSESKFLLCERNRNE
jgi:hypothetical protein